MSGCHEDQQLLGVRHRQTWGVPKPGGGWAGGAAGGKHMGSWAVGGVGPAGGGGGCGQGQYGLWMLPWP